MTTQTLQIWKGVVKGGVAKAYMLQKRYEEAYALLLENLKSSTHFKQWDDVADVQNALAEIDKLKHPSLALSRYVLSYQLALRSTKLSTLVTAAEGASSIFALQKQYDSAYHYHQRYLQWKNQLDDEMNKSRLDVVKAQVDFEKTQEELLKSQNHVINQKRIRNFILLAIVFLTIIILLLYNRKRLHMRLQYEKLEKDKQQSVAEMIDAQRQIDFVLEKVAEKEKLIKQLQHHVMEMGSLEISTELDKMTIFTEKDWQKFKGSFEILHPGLLDRLMQKMPGITSAEQRIILLAKLGFGTKEMAAATGVSSETIRSVISRMRKKFGLEADIHSIAKDV